MSSLADRIAALSPQQKRALRARLAGSGLPSIEPLPRDGRDFPLSYSQERLWFLDQLVPGNPFYNISIAQRLSFTPDMRHLNDALAMMVARHESLRTVFPQSQQQPVQRVLPQMTIRCEVHDLRSDPEREARAAQIASVQSQQPFNLAVGPLLHCRLLQLGPAQAVLLLVIHHIVADGWSLERLFGEIGRTYGELASGRRPILPALPVQYADYAVWQRRTMAGERLERHRSYWMERLTGLPQLTLPTDYPRPPHASYRGARSALAIDAVTVSAAEALAHRLKTTRFVVLLAAFGALLHRLAGQDEVAIGTPMAARPHPELEDVVGFFANTIVLRLDYHDGCSFEQAVARTHARLREAQDHQDLPFSMVVSALAPEQDLSRNPLFQVSFQVLSSSQATSAAADVASSLAFERGTSAFDLTLQLSEATEGMEGQLEFSTDLFERQTAIQLAQRFVRTLSAALSNPAAPVDSLPLLDTAELDRLNVWSRGPTLPLPAMCVHELIEAQVRRTPNAVACVAPDGELRYAELNAGANSMAQRLQGCGVTPGERVGVSLEPSTALLMALLAVLKAGAAYVPLEPSLPIERARGMLADAGARILLAQRTVDPALVDGLTLLPVDSEMPLPVPSSSAPRLDPKSLAYVLFTSGSSGHPKGVAVSHRALLNYLLWCLDTYPVHTGEGAPLCTSVSADMSVTTLFVPLLCGKTVFLLPATGLDALEHALHAGRHYSFVKLTPSHLEGLRHLAGDGPPACAAACFIVGGEALLGETLAPWRRHVPGLLIANEYGPTETTVGCCAHLLRASEVQPGPVPIGRPIANMRMYVCDPAGAPLPVGVVGELRIGGAGVALGYVSLPELSAERFVPGPDGEPVYRSGDCVRYRGDGVLEYLGRTDDQIKLRGHRVEPAEVELALRAHPAVADAVVVLHRAAAGDDRLLAALRLASGAELDDAALAEAMRMHLQGRLPAYMVPTTFRCVQNIPLTSNGKADRARIAALLADTQLRRARVAPATPLEHVVAHCFAEVLKIAQAGATDDFFADLGGHSLLATRLVSQLRELLQIEIPLRMAFEARSVKALADALAPDAADRQRLETVAAIVFEVLSMSEAEVRQRLDDAEGGLPCA